MTLTVGHIAYANCAPFFHHLPGTGFDGRIVSGVPVELNRLLAGGEIDVSPSSSFEYAQHWRDYLLLPGHSISSVGPVQSVLLFSPNELSALDGVEIALTGESATSINLLQILLRELAGCQKVCCKVAARPVEEVIAEGGHALLIGDRALRASLNPPEGTRIYDLGALWYHLTGLPFVFALWIVRRDVVENKALELSRFVGQLQVARELAFADLDQLARQAPERDWLGERQLVAYWQQMCYELDAFHQQGLELFFHLCHKHGLLSEMPQICFWTPGA